MIKPRVSQAVVTIEQVVDPAKIASWIAGYAPEIGNGMPNEACCGDECAVPNIDARHQEASRSHNRKRTDSMWEMDV
jgi:hypothetical protein